MQDITIKNIAAALAAANDLLGELSEEINERTGEAIALQHALHNIPSDALANLDELLQLFKQSATIYAGGEENADLDEMMDVSERSVALAEKMGVIEAVS